MNFQDNKFTWFLIDDDEDDRDIFNIAVKDVAQTINVVEAVGAEEGLAMLSDRTIVPQCIFLDLNMPRMSGTECLLEIRKRVHLDPVPVIIYSTSNAERDRRAALAAGAVHFFTKPASIDSLSKILRSIFERQFTFSN